MFTFAIATMLASGAALPSYTLPPGRPARCSGSCADRYRLPMSDDDAMLKERAVRDDGSKCNVVGAKRCTSKPRTILRSSY